LDADVTHAVYVRADMALAEIGILHVAQLVLAVLRTGHGSKAGQNGLRETRAKQRDAVD
jgi:hypothetical protein